MTDKPVFSSANTFSAFVTGLMLCLLTLLPLNVQAIVIRHDRADVDYVIDASRYPQLFYLQERSSRKVCLATLISGNWAITAGHCVEDTPLRDTLSRDEDYPVIINGRENRIVRLELHPQYFNSSSLEGVDLALLQLAESVPGVTPVALQRSANEMSQTATLLGWGYTGTGNNERRHNDGRFRRAYNLVSDASRWLHFSFDDPRAMETKALSLEGIPGLGDSGGPALLETSAGTFLIGVAVGEMDRSADNVARGLYGAEEIYERIFLHLDWIDAITANK